MLRDVLEARVDLVDQLDGGRDVQALQPAREGGDAMNTVRKLPGKETYPNLTLKRGVAGDLTLWNWRKMVVDGKLKDARKDCTVTMMDYELKPVVTYSIINAWPKKYTGVGLKADSNEVAVEGITLCHEGFEIK